MAFLLALAIGLFLASHLDSERAKWRGETTSDNGGWLRAALIALVIVDISDGDLFD